MKKTVRVTKEFEYEIDIDDSLFTPQFVKDFQESFWELDGYCLESKYKDLFKVAAGQLANGEEYFIEGLGACASIRTAEYKRRDGMTINVVWKDIYEDMEVELVE
jgi:hypothetical protein